MNAKIVVYSWTGNAAACAVALQNALSAEPFLLVEKKERAGNRGFAMGGFQASVGKNTELKALPDLSDCDTLVLGMPLWASTTPPAINTFLKECDIKGKIVYAYVTQMGTDIPKKLEKKLKKTIEQKGGVFRHMFVVSIPRGKQMTVEAAQPRADRWAERIRSGE